MLLDEVPLKIVQKPDQPGDVPRTSANVSLARKLLDYEPSVSLRQGLRKTVEWYVKRHVSIKNKKKVVRQSDSTNSLSSMVLECKGTEVDRMFEFRKKSFSEDMTPLFTNNDVIALPVRTSTSTSRRHLCTDDVNRTVRRFRWIVMCLVKTRTTRRLAMWRRRRRSKKK